eukprot:TRINITY_DN50680_c0_g1_i1.p1 TRINITY_DN50680_c0_g1~~TRINITY_DN50680_c0_g1_i1.p1  ORF type:complete len:150 (-),score=14.59 TRINITY_DN50680_c0_g1_i1:69-518(-)
MDWPPEGIEFNTKNFDKYHHMVQYASGEARTVKVCRCWQSKRFPYCDDTHKVLIEAGDNVGPYVAKIAGDGRSTTNVSANQLQLTKRAPVPRTAAFFVAGFGMVGLAWAAATAYKNGKRWRFGFETSGGCFGGNSSPSGTQAGHGTPAA